MSEPFQERTEEAAAKIVADAYQRAREIERPKIAELAAAIDDEITMALGSARAWTKLGHNATGNTWIARLGRLEAIHRLLLLIGENQQAVAKAIREKVS